MKILSITMQLRLVAKPVLIYFFQAIFLLVIKFKDIKFRVLNFNAGKNLVFIVKSEWHWQNKTKLRHIRKNKQTSV